MYDDDVPGRRHHHRHRPRRGPRMRDRRQRRHGEGRHLFPDDGEEAPARAGDRARRTACPASTWSTRGGANLPNQDEVFPDRDHFGRIFYNQANMSAAGIPQIAVVMGSCTAGGAYVPAMSDETIIVKNQGTIFLGGPPLVKAATGEVVTRRGAGRRRRASRAVSGVADHYAENDAHALAIARAHRRASQPRASIGVAGLREPRRARSTTPKELYGIIPADPRKPYDVREVIARHRRRQPSSTSSSRSTARRWSAASRTSGAIRSASSPTTASCSRNPR